MPNTIGIDLPATAPLTLVCALTGKTCLHQYVGHTEQNAQNFGASIGHTESCPNWKIHGPSPTHWALRARCAEFWRKRWVHSMGVFQSGCMPIIMLVLLLLCRANQLCPRLPSGTHRTERKQLIRFLSMYSFIRAIT